MHTSEIQKIKHYANVDVVRKSLIQLFESMGFDSFDRLIFPPLVANIPIMLPLLRDKIEIIPHADSIDTINGRAELGWNLFVLGTQRMFIGKTYHNNLKELAMQIRNGDLQCSNENIITASYQTTPRKIILFITRVLNNYEDGLIDLRQSPSNFDRAMPKSMMSSLPQSNQFGSLS